MSGSWGSTSIQNFLSEIKLKALRSLEIWLLILFPCWLIFFSQKFGQHSIDYWLWVDLIAPESERLLKNVVRVHQQEEADLFYVPFFTTISFFLLEKQQCKTLYRVWVYFCCTFSWLSFCFGHQMLCFISFLLPIQYIYKMTRFNWKTHYNNDINDLYHLASFPMEWWNCNFWLNLGYLISYFFSSWKISVENSSE